MEYNNEIKRKNILEKCINNSYQCRNKLSVSMYGWRNKLFNLKDSMKYNLVNLNIKFVPKDSLIHILNKTYDPNEQKDLDKLNKELNKFLLITYRSNYKEQINTKNESKYTSDCGWGCMIRSSQMIFSRIIYKIFKLKSKEKISSDLIVNSIIPFFMEDNIYISDINKDKNEYIKIRMDNYIEQLNKFLEEKTIKNEYKKLDIKSIDPPFSIHKICTLGEIYGRTCGEWFSDFELPKIYEIINSTFNIIPNLSILHFNSDLEVHKVIEKCLERIEDSNAVNLSEKEYFMNEKKDKFILKRMGAIFVSVRLGVSSISPEYFPSIKKLFQCKQFIGFIGGKVNSASYFFGYDEDGLLYLDPHYNQESNNGLDLNNFKTYLQKTVYILPFKSLQCAFTIGFLFRDIREFRELYFYLKSLTVDKNCCFHIQFEPYKDDVMIPEKEIENFNNEGDDF